MKLIIYTQCEENYGAYDWDGRGQCPQYWKPKGGNTYVVRNISQRQADKISKSGIPTLTELLTESDVSFREYIIGRCLVEDDAKECEDWESPIVLQYDVTAGQWKAGRVIKNDEHGYMAPQIKEKIEGWTLGTNGQTLDYITYYRLRNDDILSFDQLEQYLAEVAEAKEVDTAAH